MAVEPTLGGLLGDWIEWHCRVPDGEGAGDHFELAPEQLDFVAGHYTVKRSARIGEKAQAFRYRRSQLVRAQKWGKSPLIAAFVCAEGVGPVLFAGWAVGGEVYDCRDHGCGCGFLYEYEPGEPMGRPWPTPLIQITATTEDQTENTYGALRPMIELGPLAELIPRTGEEFIRLPNGGRIDVVTSKATSRLGQRVTFVPQDETGIWTDGNKMTKTARTQRRGLAGMGGRAIETTNPWDPSENSQAQQTFESSAKDILRDFRHPPADLRWSVKRERIEIMRFNYAGVPWALNNLQGIMAEVEELDEKNPAEAERFFGNRVVAGSRSWLDMAKWAGKLKPREVPAGTKIALGFDGSDVNDWSGIRAETLTGYQFTPEFNGRPTIWDPAQTNGRIPRGEVSAAVEYLFETYSVVRMYCDPPYWQSEIDSWEALWEKRVIRFVTSSPPRMHLALERFKTDVGLKDSILTHDDCQQTMFHLRNAVERSQPSMRYILGKASDEQKIDLAMSSVLAHEAAMDAIADGANVDDPDEYVHVMSY